MKSSVSFFLNEGLFDFDFTFLSEALLFLLFSFVVTSVFIVPIGKQLDDRDEFIDYNLRKSTILLHFGYQKLLNCVEFLVSEVSELNRQNKSLKNYLNSHFEKEIQFV